MIAQYRRQFNQKYSESQYQAMLDSMTADYGFKIDFKICETPIFIGNELKNELIKAAQMVLSQALSPEYMKQMPQSIPSQCFVPNDTSMPTFMVVDFAICKDQQGNFLPQLIELQGFPSLFGYQYYLSQKFKEYFGIGENMTAILGGHTEQTYLETLRKVILEDNDPENVVLMEIEPERQKTRIDFEVSSRLLGTPVVCLTKIRKQGNRLFYEKKGKLIPIYRIYNRVIFDELDARKDLKPEFDMRQEADITWAGHPNWYFKLSKYTLPFLDNKYVPKTQFLSEIKEIPADLENYVLKPLYSFAGAGVKFDVNRADIDEISVDQRHNFILMRKVQYVPVIETLDVPAKAEVRLLFAYDQGQIKLLTNLVRLSKGQMIGVDFNKDKTWVGGTVGFFERF